jgi:hypothetical protein
MTDVYCGKTACINNTWKMIENRQYHVCQAEEVEITKDGNCFNYEVPELPFKPIIWKGVEN